MMSAPNAAAARDKIYKYQVFWLGKWGPGDELMWPIIAPMIPPTKPNSNKPTMREIRTMDKVPSPPPNLFRFALRCPGWLCGWFVKQKSVHRGTLSRLDG